MLRPQDQLRALLEHVPGERTELDRVGIGCDVGTVAVKRINAENRRHRSRIAGAEIQHAGVPPAKGIGGVHDDLRCRSRGAHGAQAPPQVGECEVSVLRAPSHRVCRHERCGQDEAGARGNREGALRGRGRQRTSGPGREAMKHQKSSEAHELGESGYHHALPHRALVWNHSPRRFRRASTGIATIESARRIDMG